jgi:hypothetical protein
LVPDLTGFKPLPGIPCARRTDNGGLRVAARLAMLACPGCGYPLRLVITRSASTEVKTFRCGMADCRRIWKPVSVKESGGPLLIALILQT